MANLVPTVKRAVFPCRTQIALDANACFGAYHVIPGCFSSPVEIIDVSLADLCAFCALIEVKPLHVECY